MERGRRDRPEFLRFFGVWADRVLMSSWSTSKEVPGGWAAKTSVTSSRSNPMPIRRATWSSSETVSDLFFPLSGVRSLSLTALPSLLLSIFASVSVVMGTVSIAIEVSFTPSK